jgi:hypothetical protein
VWQFGLEPFRHTFLRCGKVFLIGASGDNPFHERSMAVGSDPQAMKCGIWTSTDSQSDSGGKGAVNGLSAAGKTARLSRHSIEKTCGSFRSKATVCSASQMLNSQPEQRTLAAPSIFVLNETGERFYSTNIG